MLITIISTFAVFLYTFLVTIYRHDVLNKLFKYEIYESKNSLFCKIITYTLVYYDAIFHLINILSFNITLCDYQYLVKEVDLDAGTGSAWFVTDNSDIIASSLSVSPGSEWRSVSYANSSCDCLSQKHVIIIFLGLIIHIANLILKYLSNKIKTFFPNKNIISSKYGNLDLAYELFIYLMII